MACDLDPDFLSVAGTFCRDVAAQGTTDDTCTEKTDCAAGYSCLGSSAGRSCKQLCNVKEDCGGGLCAMEVTYGPNGDPVPGVKVCTIVCNPLDGTGCPSGWGCDILSLDGSSDSFTWCAVAGSGGPGDACTNPWDCGVGFTCYPPSGSGQCIKFCDPAGAPCLTGTCSVVMPINGQNVGGCM